MSEPGEVREEVGRAVDFYERGIISLASPWQTLDELLTPANASRILASLPARQQAVLRRGFRERPLSIVRDGEWAGTRQEIAL